MATAGAPVIGVNSVSIAYYLQRICTFLNSDKKTLSFPNISQELQDVLVKISTENTEFLSGDGYDEKVKIEAAKLAATLKTHANFKLAHDICNGKHGPNVLMYKKIEVGAIKMPPPLRRPGVIPVNDSMEPPADGTLSTIFKTRCLNASTMFVKDNSQLVLTFPEMVASQAEFVVNMIQPGLDAQAEKTDIGFGYRSMYAPLWESMRLFSLKYEYRIEYDTRPVSKEGMKRVVFKKIPKRKKVAALDSDGGDTPVIIIIDSDDENISDDSSSSSTAGLNTRHVSAPVRKKIMSTAKQGTKEARKSTKLIQKMGALMERGELLEGFIHDSLRRISELLEDDQQKSIMFNEASQPEQHFLTSVTRLSNNTNSYMLFSAECQQFLDCIKYCLNVRKIKYRVVFTDGLASTYQELRRANGEVKIIKTTKDLEFVKISPEAQKNGAEALKPQMCDLSSKSSSSVSSIGSGSKGYQKVAELDTKVKKYVKKVVSGLVENQRKGIITEKFMKATLERIVDFMSDEQQASVVLQSNNHAELQFIEKVRCFAREEELYRMFSGECRKLLADINCYYHGDLLYHMRSVKGRKDVILQKMPRYDSSNDKCSSSTSISTTSVRSNATAARSDPTLNKHAMRAKDKMQKAIKQIYERIRSGLLSKRFVEDTLQRICAFMYDEQATALLFNDLQHIQHHFVKHLEAIARDGTWNEVFSAPAQLCLADLKRCIKRNMLYHFAKVKVKGKNTIEVIIRKLAFYPTEELLKEKENDDLINANNNIASRQSHAQAQSVDQLLDRLRAIKAAVVRTSGEQAIVDYLQDIANFLTASNEDSVLTFENVSEHEAAFLKQVHSLSKLAAGRAMFPRACQKLLASILNNAKAYKLRFEMHADNDDGDLWKVLIVKQLLSANKKNGVPHRARSLSGSRRTLKGNATVAPSLRDSSVPRPRLSVKATLKAGLSQPVHSDKALRIMECMGWKGGALGARGDGITEPIALPIDLAKRAGLGHVSKPKNTRPEPRARKANPVKQQAPLPSSSTARSLPGIQPVASLPSDVIPPGILPKGLVGKRKTVVLGKQHHEAALKSILEIITTNIEEIHFISERSPSKVIGFLKHVVTAFNGRLRLSLEDAAQQDLVAQISQHLDNRRDIVLHAAIREKTDLYPELAVLKVLKLAPVLPKKISPDEVISLIDDEEICQLTTNEQATTKHDQETTIDPATIWYQTTETKTTDRQWYLPVISKRQNTDTQKQKTTDNKISELKTLALSAVCKMVNTETDVEILETQKAASNFKTESQTDLPCLKDSETRKTHVKKSKVVLKIPNMTRKQLSICQQQGKVAEVKNQRTTYTVELEKYKLNKVNHTNVKVTKNLETHSMEPKKMKLSNDQSQDETNTKMNLSNEQQTVTNTENQQEDDTSINKSGGVLMLGKFTRNNNGLTKDNNITMSVEKEKNERKVLVAARLQNVAHLNATAINDETINKTAPSASTCDTDLCEKNYNVKVVEDNIEPNNNSGIQTNTESVTYYKPAERKLTVEEGPINNIIVTIQNNKDIVTKENNTEHEETKKPIPENTICKNKFDDKDNERDILLDDSKSMIVINSEDEVILVDADDDIENTDVTNKLTTEKVEVYDKNVSNEIDAERFMIKLCQMSRKVLKAKHTSIKVTQNATDVVVNAAVNYNDSKDGILEKPALIEERKRPSVDYLTSELKKCKLPADFQKIHILPKDPQSEMDIDKARKLQSAILISIDYTQGLLPCLKCEGIQNGGLIYSCKDKESLVFLENLILNMTDFKIVYDFEVKEHLNHKMAFRINSYIDEPVCDVLNRLDLYNTRLNATQWVIVKKERCGDFSVIHVEVDVDSFNYICQVNFVLYAGNDCARFTIVWD